MFSILIDSGTTNSRIRLVSNENNIVRDSEKIKVGVRNTAIDGHNQKLKDTIYDGIGQLLKRNHLNVNEVIYVIASGMITSNLGLFEVPHVKSPVTIEKLANLSQVVKLDVFHGIPCIFVPGVSNSVENDELINNYDVMRGEEVESFGLVYELDLKGKGTVIIPGSHTKFIFIDENRTIISCLSTLTGEMLSAIQYETILSDSLNSSLIESVDEEYLIKGFKANRHYGLTRTLYHVRLLHLFKDLNVNERANYFVGAILAEDIHSYMNAIDDVNNLNWIVVGGSNPLRHAFTVLLQYVFENFNVIETTDLEMEDSIIKGAKEIANIVEENIKSTQK